MVEFDAIFKEISEFGRYQKFVVFLLTIPGCIMNAYNAYGILFMMHTPNHRCKLYANETLTHPASFDSLGNAILTFNETSGTLHVAHEKSCEIKSYSLRNISLLANVNFTTVSMASGAEETIRRYHSSAFSLSAVDGFSGLDTTGCKYGHLFDRTYFDATLVTDWDLVCQHAIEPKVALSLMSVFTVIGCFLISWIQDKFGRKMAFIVCLLLYIVPSLLSLAATNIWIFTLIRVITSIALASWNVCYIWALEIVGPSKRTLASTIMCMVYSVGTMTVGIIAYACRSWIDIGLITTLPFCLLFVYHWLIAESPRWLLAQGRVKETEAVLSRIARWEGKELRQEKLEDLLQRVDVNDNDPTSTARHRAVGLNTLDLFRSKNLRSKTLLITFCWIANAVVYLTIPYNMENLSANIYVAYVLQASTEIPATLLNLATLNRFGRIWPLFLAMTGTGLACLLCAPGPLLPEWFIVAMAIVAKFGISSGYDIIYQLAGEVYPTVVRGTGIGFSSLIGEVFNIVMPYIIYSAEAYRMLPMIILGVLAIVGGASALLLPETLNQSMPQTIEDGEKLGAVGLASFRKNVLCCTGRYKKTHAGDREKGGLHQRTLTATPLLGNNGQVELVGFNSTSSSEKSSSDSLLAMAVQAKNDNPGPYEMTLNNRRNSQDISNGHVHVA